MLPLAGEKYRETRAPYTVVRSGQRGRGEAISGFYEVTSKKLYDISIGLAECVRRYIAIRRLLT